MAAVYKTVECRASRNAVTEQEAKNGEEPDKTAQYRTVRYRT